MNISLPSTLKTWVEAQAQDGRYANSSDYVRDLIRRDQTRGHIIAEVQAALDAGRASGAATAFDPAAFKRGMQD